MRVLALLVGALFAKCVSSIAINASGNQTRKTNHFLSTIGVDPAVLPAGAAGQTGCALACSILGAAFRASFVSESSNHTLYTTEADAYWSASAYKSPRCIINPSELQTLSSSVKIAVFTQCPFAVRSGGHSPFSGFAGIDNGLLISMAQMKDISYDKNTKVLRAGMGNRWGDVYSYLSDKGRIVVGGRLNDVGLALATGGGLSHLSSQHGWVSQNVESYEIMLADGTHVTASSTEHPDLYFSVKTGNNNFGIVTHINFKTYPISNKVWGGAVTYSTKYSADFMAAIAEYQLNGQNDTKSALLPYIAVGNDTILATFSYLDGIEKPDAFAPFYSIPNTSDTTQVLDSFYELASGSLPSLPRFTYAATSLYLDEGAYLEVLNITVQFNSQVQQILSGTLVLMVQPISEAMIEQSKQKGHNPLDSVVSKPQLWVSINIGWSLESDDQFVFELLEECITAIEDFTKAKKVFDPFIFINDAAPFQRPLQEYGENTFQKLRSTSRKYDPTGVFQSLVPGGFKVLT